MHILIGATLIPLVGIHTGGRWGVNLNGLLLACLVGTIVIGVTGKIGEAWRLHRVERLGPSAGHGKGSAFHANWLRVHVALVSIFTALLAFHIFSVYYF